jgi:methyl-accepting chemotaxis protein
MKKRITKKTLLHDEVQSRISKMLTNKNILYQNNPIDNTETNARLIKSFLYRKISSKYPRYNSFTKISTIHNLNDNDLSNLLLDLPNLDEWNASIQQNKEKRNANRKNQSHVSDEEEIDNIVENAEEIVENAEEIVENVNTTEENVNTTEENVNTTEENVKNSTKSNSNENNELTSNECNELNENFNLTDKILGIVRKIVIVYAFYKLAKWFI